MICYLSYPSSIIYSNVIGIPAFIRFYQRAHTPANKCTKMKQHKAKAGTQLWGVFS